MEIKRLTRFLEVLVCEDVLKNDYGSMELTFNLAKYMVNGSVMEDDDINMCIVNCLILDAQDGNPIVVNSDLSVAEGLWHEYNILKGNNRTQNYIKKLLHNEDVILVLDRLRSIVISMMLTNMVEMGHLTNGVKDELSVSKFILELVRILNNACKDIEDINHITDQSVIEVEALMGRAIKRKFVKNIKQYKI